MAPDGRCAGGFRTFRQRFYQCLVRRADALFEPCEAVRCVEGSAPAHWRSYPWSGSIVSAMAGLYAGLVHGWLDIDHRGRLWSSLRHRQATGPGCGRHGLATPRGAHVIARILCHTYGRGKDSHMMDAVSGPRRWTQCGWC